MSETNETPQPVEKKVKAAEPTVAITAKDLKEIVSAAVATAIQESKKPSLLEQRQLDAEAKKEDEKQVHRKEQAAQILEKAAKQRAFQKVCVHKHKTGQSYCVYISGGHYILCQLCQVKVSPDPKPAQPLSGFVYDVDLFNVLFQTAVNAQTEVFG